MKNILGIVFDLDDTLYLEREYVRSGFRRIAEDAGTRCGLSTDEVFSFLWGRFESGVRGDTIDQMLTTYPQIAARFAACELVGMYRSHAPQIEMLPQMTELLARLRSQGMPLGVVSDGPLASQAAKAKALGLYGLVSAMRLTDEWGPEFWKPHPRAFLSITDDWRTEPEGMVYIGDNPAKDFLAPKRLGWHTIRLRLPEQLRFRDEAPSADFAPQLEVLSVDDLAQALVG